MQCEVTPARRSPQLALLIVTALATMAVTGAFVKQQNELDHQADEIRALKHSEPRWMGNHPDPGVASVLQTSTTIPTTYTMDLYTSSCRVEFGANHSVGVVTLAADKAACGVDLDPEPKRGHSCSVGPLDPASDQVFTVTLVGDRLDITRSNLQVGMRRFAFVCMPRT